MQGTQRAHPRELRRVPLRSPPPARGDGWAWNGLANQESQGQGNSRMWHCSATPGATHGAAPSQATPITATWSWLAGSTPLLGSYRIRGWFLTWPSPPIWKLSRQWNLVAYIQSEVCNLLFSGLSAGTFPGDRYKKKGLEQLLYDKFRPNPTFCLPKYPLPLHLRTVG